jgi:hypothetical protein
VALTIRRYRSSWLLSTGTAKSARSHRACMCGSPTVLSRGVERPVNVRLHLQHLPSAAATPTFATCLPCAYHTSRSNPMQAFHAGMVIRLLLAARGQQRNDAPGSLRLGDSPRLTGWPSLPVLPTTRVAHLVRSVRYALGKSAREAKKSGPWGLRYGHCEAATPAHYNVA